MDDPIGRVCGAIRERDSVQAERVGVLERGPNLRVRVEPVVDLRPRAHSWSWLGETPDCKRLMQVLQAYWSGMGWRTATS